MEIAVDIVKDTLNDEGYKISKVDLDKINGITIKLVKEKKEILEETPGRERASKDFAGMAANVGNMP